MSDLRREVIADTLMDCRASWPWEGPSFESTLTYQEAMRKLADVILRELDKSAPAAAPEPSVEEPQIFDKADLGDGKWWFTTTIGDLVPQWGEGESEDAAVVDMADTFRELHASLHDWPTEKLADNMRWQRDFLCDLLDGRALRVPRGGGERPRPVSDFYLTAEHVEDLVGPSGGQ